MRIKNFIIVSVAAVCLAASASAATIQFTTTALPGPNQYRYNYTITGSLLANQALDIIFPAALYSALINPVVGPGITPFVLEPNNPPGVAGDFTLYAAAAIPTITGPFSIDFTFLGTGAPGAQAFTLDQYNANGDLVTSTAQGMTMVSGTAPVPEPAAFGLCLLGLLAGGGKWAARRFIRIDS